MPYPRAVPDWPTEWIAADPIAARLERLAADLERRYQNAVEIEREEVLGGTWTASPKRSGALSVSWIDMGEELQVEALGGEGGRWELGRTDDDVGFIEAVVDSIAAGRAREVFAPARSRLTVTMEDGSNWAETGYAGLPGCLPLPFWRRWGRTAQYLPWQ